MMTSANNWGKNPDSGDYLSSVRAGKLPDMASYPVAPWTELETGSGAEPKTDFESSPEFAHLDELALEVIQHCQNLVLVNLRFLDAAYFQLVPQPGDVYALATDGALLRFKSDYILSLFSEDQNQVARDVLHSVLHCVFHHPFVGRVVQLAHWDLACDIAVEAQIDELHLPATICSRSFEQQAALNALREELPILSAQKLYRFFLDSDMTEEDMVALRQLFYADDHRLWYHKERPALATDDPPDDSEEFGQGKPTDPDPNEPAFPDKPDGGDETKDDTTEDPGDSEQQEDSTDDQEQEDAESPTNSDMDSAGAGMAHSQGASDSDQSSDSETETETDNPADSDGDSEDPSESDSDFQGDRSSDGGDQDSEKDLTDNNSNKPQQENPLESTWDKITERMEVELETFARGQSETAAGLVHALKVINRETYDYENFLRRFAELGETMQINDDEFDYIYYTYGLKLYDKMPLVEPLEYKENYRVREFVIAIDTSASTSGKLVESFITKTFNMLKSTENFFTRVNIHIIQADNVIQDVIKITTLEEFDEYASNLQIHGVGGTDFRPVFEYVNERIKEGEFTHLGGLIYFTDGMGTFPEHQPGYKTAFVFLDDGTSDPVVPIWAIKLIMESEDL